MWDTIFTHTDLPRNDLFMLSCVCKTWRFVADSIIMKEFSGFKTTANKILIRFSESEKILDLSYNEMIKNFCLKNFHGLISLNLKENSLITFKGFSHLTNLTSLNLRNNKTVKNRAIVDLVNLKSLNLSQNLTITGKPVFIFFFFFLFFSSFFFFFFFLLLFRFRIKVARNSESWKLE